MNGKHQDRDVAIALGLITAAFLMSVATVQATELRWDIQIVDEDCGSADDWEGADTTLRFDSLGLPHVSYIHGDSPNSVLAIEYARCLGPTWDLQTVDDNNTWGHPSLVLDDADQPHLSYRENGFYAQGTLRYARPIPGGWDIQIPDAGPGVSATSIALDSQGNPHIAYYLNSVGLKYARWDGANWVFATPDPDCRAAVALVLDAQDRPFITYAAGDPWYNVRCAWFDGAVWHVETVDNATNTPYATSIALDSQGEPRVAYAKGAQSGIYYATRSGAVWTPEMIVDGNMWSPVLALDDADAPHIAWYIANDGALGYATKPGGAWETEVIEDSPSPSIRIGREPSITIGPSGRPCIAYYYHDASEPCKLKYAAARRAEDVNGDGVVDVQDLLAVLAAWGNAGGPEDVNDDGVVDVLDLLAVLAAWGS